MERILIIGCGRSGTKYTKMLFTLAGLKVGHEKDAENGTVDWHKTCEKDPAYGVTLHQVRDPLKVISSCHTIMGRSWDFICKNEPKIIRGEPLLLRCMKYWFYWNQRAQVNARWSYRVESLPKVFPKILKEMGAKVPGKKAAQKISSLPKTVHSRSKSDVYGPVLTYNGLIEAHPVMGGVIKELALAYGYKEESDEEGLHQPGITEHNGDGSDRSSPGDADSKPVLGSGGSDGAPAELGISDDNAPA